MARTVLSTKHLYALLAKSPDRPSISTVKRWVEGKQEMPSWALAAVAESLGITEKPSQSFDWEGLISTLERIEQKQDLALQRQPIVADEAVVKLTRVLATSGGSEQVRVMRAALADALAETAHGALPGDEPDQATGADEATGESKRLPRPSGRSLGG